ncbi:hypothetical protein [Costertonia aggregata]|uniref:Uncharacterized protein n=1 Tax=Costertonia aggregata TaxID=343403 RepID=A0A7H9ASF4_9FLAO|nr:hypothetical protein [Costertonia aggregata]QLG46384.1 hypothetical protein HYG79_13840 [Costertonia aggregata]
MKTKRTIYFMLITIGGMVMGFGDMYIKKEYALCIGIVLLMFGIYKSSQVWGLGNTTSAKDSEEEKK